MASMSPSVAAKAWNISRTVIYERMKKGELSFTKDANGKRQVDSVEMLRVFGEPKQSERPLVSESVNPTYSADSTALIEALQDQINTLKRQTETLSKQLEVKDEQLSQRDTQMQSLIDQLNDVNQRFLPAPMDDDYEEDEITPQPKRKWWRFGRKVESVE